MEVDTATSATQASTKHSFPEIEIYCYLLVLIFLIDQKRYNEVRAVQSNNQQGLYYTIIIDVWVCVKLSAILSYYQAKTCSSAGIARVKNLNRRTVDVLASRLYFYYSLSYELTGDLAEIRGYAFFWVV